MADETEVETVTRLQAVDIRDLYPSLAAEDATSRVCLLCAAKLKDKTHNLTRHLERHHAGALLQLLEQRNQASPSVLASRTRRAQQEKTAARQPADDALLKAGDARLALARWLAQEQLPVDLIDKSGFREFLEALNEQFTAPKREELQLLLGSLVAGQDGSKLDTLAVEMTALRATCRCSEDSSFVALSRVACDVVERGEAKVRVLRAAASLFDAQTCRGEILGKNGVLGRSFVGVVSEIQADVTMTESIVKLLDKVVASPYITGASPIQAEEQHDTAADSSLHNSQSTASCVGVSASSGSLAKYIVLPIANLCVVPTVVPDDLALLADDMSVVLSIVSELQRRNSSRIGILCDGPAMILTNLLVRYLHQSERLDAQYVHVFSTTNSSDGLRAQHASVTRIDIYQPAAVSHAELALDAVVDLIGSEASAEFATSLVQSMGCVVLVDRSRLQLHPQSTVAMDMNAVVVRELEIVSVHDSRALLDDALQYIAVQAQSPQSAAELRQCLLDGVGLSETLRELQKVSEGVLVERYLQVVMQ